MPRRAPAFWSRLGAVAWALMPLSLLFGAVAGLRRGLFRNGWLRTERLPAPLIVVGNIAVGGSGKTPVTLWLVEHLKAAGRRPGIVSRGYGGHVEGVAEVPPDGDPAHFGDEPVLMAHLAGVPVWVGRDRPAAGRALLAAHPEVDVLVCDDGLQHYRLQRDVEVVVVDQATLGNGLRLPAGPLREGVTRLARADLVLAHGALAPSVRRACGTTPVFEFHLAGAAFERLSDRGERRPPSALMGRRLRALAGIGRPERFFAQLEAMGLAVERCPLPDHHVFTPADVTLEGVDALVMTEKDAVKCAPFAPHESWVWPVRAHVPSRAAELILEKIDGSPSA